MARSIRGLSRPRTLPAPTTRFPSRSATWRNAGVNRYRYRGTTPSFAPGCELKLTAREATVANLKHVAILKRGVRTWNQWRRQNPDTVQNLTAAELNGLRLARINLTDARLNGAGLVGTDLERANLMRAELSHADLESSDLQKANLTFAKLEGTAFDEANLEGATLAQ